MRVQRFVAVVAVVTVLAVGLVEGVSTPPVGAVSEASSILSQRPFGITNPDLFSPGLYGGVGPPPAPAPGMTDTEIRTDLQSFLQDRFGVGSPRVTEGMDLLDDPTMSARVPRMALRAAVASLFGTVGEPAIAEIKDDPGFKTLDFASLPPGQIALPIFDFGDNTVNVIFNDAFQYEPYLVFSALTLHETLHLSDITNSVVEEQTNAAIQTLAYLQQLSVRPQLALSPTKLIVLENGGAMARLNSGTEDRLRMHDSQGPLFPGAGLDSYQTFPSIVVDNHTPGLPLEPDSTGGGELDAIMAGLAESGNAWTPGGTFAAALDFLDQNQGGVTSEELVAVAHALQLDVPKALSVSIGDATAYEGDTGKPRSISFAVTLSQPATTPTTVNYTIVAGTAHAPDDLNDRKGATKTVTFKPSTKTGLSATTKMVTVPITPDMADELDEGFTVVLSNPSGSWSLGRAVGVGTIADDDPGVVNRVAVGDASVVEGDAGKANKVKLWVTLDQPATSTVTVDYTITAGSATSGDDFKTVTKTLTFTPGKFKKAITVTVYPDTTLEPDETVNVTLTNPTGVTISDPNGTATILNDD